MAAYFTLNHVAALADIGQHPPVSATRRGSTKLLHAAKPSKIRDVKFHLVGRRLMAMRFRFVTIFCSPIASGSYGPPYQSSAALRFLFCLPAILSRNS